MHLAEIVQNFREKEPEETAAPNSLRIEQRHVKAHKITTSNMQFPTYIKAELCTLRKSCSNKLDDTKRSRNDLLSTLLHVLTKLSQINFTERELFTRF